MKIKKDEGLSVSQPGLVMAQFFVLVLLRWP